jgi:hypothetical protein
MSETCLHTAAHPTSLIGQSNRRKAKSHRCFKALEAERQPIPVWTILDTCRQVYRFTVEPLQGLKHRAVALPKQTLGHMQPNT